MFRKLSAILLMLTLFAGTSLAGIRGPGKYTGVVIFDRWDTCYLYSGIYLMYVSEKTKEGLRKYEGKSIVIDAKEVFQPINPGDGLIGKYKFLGLAKSKGTNLKGLSLTVVPQFENEGIPKFLLEIANSGSKPTYVETNALALTLLGAKQENMFSPSDGKSDAWLTREPFKIPSFAKEMGFGPKSNNSHPIMWKDNVEYYFNVEEELPDSIEIQPNQKTSISMSFHLPKGEFDFLSGYGGGVHEERGLTSNIVAFEVDENGRATVNNVARINRPASNNSLNRSANSAALIVNLNGFGGSSRPVNSGVGLLSFLKAGWIMSDWLSKLEEQRKKSAAQANAQAEREQQSLSAYHNKLQSSYEQNKDRIERIYNDIEKYIKRATDIGFKVEAFRPTKGFMFIKGSYTSWDGDGINHQSATLELTPWANSFLIHCNGRVSPTKKNFNIIISRD